MLRKYWKAATLLGVVLVSLLISQVEGSFNQYIFQIVIYAGINIILAVSLNLINGHTGQFSLGHAGFMAIGAYTAAVLTRDVVGSWGMWIGFPVALIGGGLMAAVAGVVVGIPSLRLRGDYLAIVTLGFGEIIRVIIQNLDFVGGARGFAAIPKLTDFFWVFAIVGLVMWSLSNLVKSTYGKGFLAVRDDEIAAEAMGINTTRYKVTAFVTGAFFAGLAGGLYAHYVTYITPTQFSFILSIEHVMMVIVGGMGSNVGVAFAAVLLTVLKELLKLVPDLLWFLPEWLLRILENRMLLFSILLVVIMILRPQGLFGEGDWVRRWWRKLTGRGRKAEATA